MLGHYNHTAPIRVPNVAYQSLSLLADMLPFPDNDGLAGFYQYSGPSSAVQRVVAATAAQAAILPIAAPNSNSTWVNRFMGPGLFCESVNASTRHDFEENIAEQILNSCDTPQGYITWSPAEAEALINSSYLPYVKQADGDGSYTFNDVPWISLSGSSNQTLYMVAAPGLMEVTVDPSLPDVPISKACKLIGWDLDKPGQGPEGVWRNATFAERVSALFSGTETMLQCHLYNTSYTATFTYVNGAQDVGVSTDPMNGPLGLEVGDFGSDADVSNCTLTSPDRNCTLLSYKLDILSYQAVFDAFRSLLRGTVSTSQDLTLHFDSNIMMTALPEVAELSFLSNASSFIDTPLPPLQTAINTWPGSLVRGLSNGRGTHSTLSLLQALEDLFQNVTISLMSEAQLQANETSAFAPPLTDVTFFESNIQVYSYDSVKLWAAYGCAIGVSALAVLLGFWTVFDSGAVYSDNFSTLLRVTREVEMSVDIALADRDGKDPLPGYLADSTIAFPAPRSKGRVRATYSAVPKADGRTDA
ncbi:hypothetical protein LTR17_001901 [Elasticomyces elasticus]|nr:hypothetical protein LTR17_001901 [Elasticomyces elasticus]